MNQSQLAVAMAIAIVLAAGASARQPATDPVHDQLKLSPSQDAAWAAYRATVPDPAHVEQRRAAAATMYPKLPTPRRMDLVEAEMTAELSELRRESAALKSFYGTLTPDQQKLFDQTTLKPPPADD